MGLGRLFTACLLSDCCQHEAKQRASSSRDAPRIHSSASARLRPYPEAEESNALAREIADEKMKSSSTSPTTQTTSGPMALAPTLPTHFDSVRQLPRPRAPPSVPPNIASAQTTTQPTPAYPSSVAISNRGSHSLHSTTSAASIQTASATAPPGPTRTARDDSAGVMRSIATPSLTFDLRRLGCDLSTTTPLTSSSAPVSGLEDPDAAGPGPISTASFPTLSEVAPRNECEALMWPDTHLNQEPCPLAPARWQQQPPQRQQLHAQTLRPQRSTPEPWEHNASTAAVVSISAAAAAALEARNSLPATCQQQLPPLHQHTAAHSVQIHTLRHPPEGGDLSPHPPQDFNAMNVAAAAASAAAQSLTSGPLTGLKSSGVLCPHPSRAFAAAAASSSLQISLSGTERSPCPPSPSAGASIAMLSAPCTLPPSTATPPSTPLQAGAPSDLTGVIRPCRLSELVSQLSGLRWLASGSSGRVYTGLWQGSPVAVKVLLSSTPDQLRESTREALLSRVVSHPAICQCYTVCSEFILPEHLQLPTTRTAYSGRSATLSATSIATPYNANTTQSVSRSLSIHLNACGAAGSSTCCGGGGGGGGGGGPVGCGPSMKPGGFPSPRLGRGVEEEGEAISRSKSMSTVEAAEAAGAEVMPSVCSPGQGRQGRRLRLPSGRRESRRASVTQQSSHLATTEADRNKAAAATAATPAALCGSPAVGAAAAGATLSSSTLAGVPSPAALGNLLMHAGEAGGLTSASSSCSAAAAREARWQRTLGCGSELYTTLSLSELLRTYAPADDDVASGGAAAGSLPAVLLSRGADPGRCCTVVVMEWCKQGTLLQAIRSQTFNPERSAENAAGLLALLRTALEVAQGMAYLHSLDIIHGDLKPSNVLLQSHAAQVSRKLGVGMWAADMRGYVAKVADFGMSVPAHSNSIGTAVSGSAPAPPGADSGGGGGGAGCGGGGAGDCNWGALAYLAPEVPDSGPSKKSDVHSYGCVLYHMCTGKQPFRGIRQGRLLIGLATGALTLQWPDNVYRVLWRLGKACCATDPRQRPSFDKLVKALQKTIAYVTSTPSPGGSGASLTGGRKTLSGGRTPSQGSRRRGSGCGAGAGPVGEEEEVATAAAAWRLALAGCGQLEGLELFAPLPAACGVPGSGAGREAGGGRVGVWQ